MKYKYTLNFFRSFDVIGFDEYINDMYQQGWMIESSSLFMRFRKVEDTNGYLYYNNIGNWDEDIEAQKCLEYGFVEVGDKLYLGNSKLNLEKLQQWRLEKEASKSNIGIYLLLFFTIALLGCVVYFETNELQIGLFDIISGYANFELFYYIILFSTSFFVLLQELIYRNNLKQKILSGESFERAGFELGSKLLVLINVILLIVLFGISIITYYPFNYIAVGVILLMFVFVILLYCGKSSILNLVEKILIAFLLFTYNGILVDSIEYDFTNQCVIEEGCHTLNRTVKNVFYDLSMRDVRSSLWFDYYESKYDFIKEYTIKHHLEEHNLILDSSLNINADSVYSNGEGQYLIVKDDYVIFVYFVKDKYTIEDINAIL